MKAGRDPIFAVAQAAKRDGDKKELKRIASRDL
jgi:hypothetical protein